MQRRVPVTKVQPERPTEQEAAERLYARKAAKGRPPTGKALTGIYSLTAARLRAIQAALTQAATSPMSDATERLVVEQLAYIASRIGEPSDASHTQPAKGPPRYSVQLLDGAATGGHTLVEAAALIGVKPASLKAQMSANGGTYHRNYPAATCTRETRPTPEES